MTKDTDSPHQLTSDTPYVQSSATMTPEQSLLDEKQNYRAVNTKIHPLIKHYYPSVCCTIA